MISTQEHNDTHERLKSAEKSIVRFEKQLEKRRASAMKRFPILFVLLSSFGLVSTFYGFEKLIDATTLFTENPWVLLVTGITILTLTGALYKKL